MTINQKLMFILFQDERHDEIMNKSDIKKKNNQIKNIKSSYGFESI